ncbi:MAG: hypothetical protein LBE09_06265 [Christensenellaceae bacterium]|jgi:NRPS condensation-like uncharacterized protein|nr:hypothetical protein [Christensenellaceae bacterium]
MKYKAETWDKMQDIMSRYNDHMTHGYLEFDSHIDADILKDAMRIAVDKFPILKCTYYSGIFRAQWKSLKKYNFDDYYQFAQTTENLMDYSERFLVGKIDEKHQAQFKFMHVRNNGADAICLLINHQCMDGADLKVFYNCIAALYNDILNGGNGDLRIKNGTRSEMQLYNDFSQTELEELDKLISYSKKQKSKLCFPFAKAKKSSLYAKIHKLRLSQEKFAQMKANGKKFGVSINDIILGAFYRAALKMIAPKPDQTLGIPNMVNMRRYIKSGDSAGFCNLTSMIVLNLGNTLGDDIFETIARCKMGMDKLKNNYPGFHGWALLRRVFKYAPHGLAKFLIGTFFKNPLVGLSNIGLIDHEGLTFGNAKLASPTYMTGSIKIPPYMQLALTTLYNEITFTVANYGNSQDHEMLKLFLDILDAELTMFINADITPDFTQSVFSKIN